MNISTSIRKLTQLFVVLFIALSGGLVYWQVVVANTVTQNPHNGRSCLLENAPKRGRIFDRNGVLLAESVVDPNGRCGYTRRYTDPSLAGLIGYYVPGFGVTGIENQYNDYLSGKVGTTALDNTVNSVLHQAPVGDDIYLTIDDRIQKIADQHFSDETAPIDNNSTFATDRGSVVVTDPHTGEVLAMVSRPSFDPNKMVQTLSHSDLSYFSQLNSDKEQPLLERPLQSTYVPGSIYKAVTLMAGLNSGATTLDQQFNAQQAIGPVEYKKSDGAPSGVGPVGNNLSYIGDPTATGYRYTIHMPVSTSYGFAHSDNVIFAQVGTETGAQKWLDFNKQMYIGQQPPFDLPVMPSKVQTNDQPLSDYDLANDSFGQGLDQITPFQMSLFDNVIANNGNLMRPMLIGKITDHSNNAVQENNPSSLGTPITADAATQVRQAMYGVTFCGSGLVPNVGINLSKWGILSKTGTGQVSNDLKTGAESWLFTQAPYSVNSPSTLPALTVIAMKENGGEGGKANGPLTSAIYNDVFSNVQPYASQVKAPGVAAPTYCCSAKLLQVGCPNQ